MLYPLLCYPTALPIDHLTIKIGCKLAIYVAYPSILTFFDYLMEDSQELVGHCRKDSFLSTRYELHEQLGSGCFGQIFRATNKKTLGTVALKV